MSFEACLPIILQSEGGFVNNPADPGGATNLGVTLNTLSSWLGRAATITDVQALTPASVAPIYQARYWNVCSCDAWDSGVDLMVFDEAVNQGPGRAITTLQAALGVTADGSAGPATLAAAQLEDAAATIAKIAALREAFYRSLSTFSVFGTGWLNRLNRTTALAQKMAQGG